MADTTTQRSWLRRNMFSVVIGGLAAWTVIGWIIKWFQSFNSPVGTWMQDDAGRFLNDRIGDGAADYTFLWWGLIAAVAILSYWKSPFFRNGMGLVVLIILGVTLLLFSGKNLIGPMLGFGNGMSSNGAYGVPEIPRAATNAEREVALNRSPYGQSPDEIWSMMWRDSPKLVDPSMYDPDGDGPYTGEVRFAEGSNAVRFNMRLGDLFYLPKVPINGEGCILYFIQEPFAGALKVVHTTNATGTELVRDYVSIEALYELSHMDRVTIGAALVTSLEQLPAGVNRADYAACLTE